MWGEMRKSTANRLMQAAREGILVHGAAGCSARVIADIAHTNASAINYSFGGMKQLFAAVFAEGIDAAETFIRAIEEELDLWPAPPAATALLLEIVIRRWVAQPRGDALFYQQALASRDAAPELIDRWLALWAAFFYDLARRQGLSAMQGDCLNLLFQSEALFALSQWRPVLEGAALRDIVGHFGAVWLGGPAYSPTGALAAAEAAVRYSADANPSGAAGAMMMAAVDVVAEHGLAGLTHRAVAARCGVTAGAVAHYYRTAADLLAAAIRGQVLALQAQSASSKSTVAVGSLEDLAAALTIGTSDPFGMATASGRRHLFLASLTKAEHIASGAVVRFAAGATVREGVRSALPGDPATDIHASLLSRLLTAAVMVGLGDGAAVRNLAASVVSTFADGVQSRGVSVT